MKKALDLFRRLEWVCLVIPMAVLCLLIVINILMRAFMASGISWLEEFSRYVFVFCTFLGASIAVETDQHPKMTALVDGVPYKASLVLKIVGDLFCCVLSILVAYYGCTQISRMMSMGAQATSMPIPMFVPYLIIPVGMLVAGVRYLCLAICNIRALGKPAPTVPEDGGAAL